jgi:hypothetical protein
MSAFQQVAGLRQLGQPLTDLDVCRCRGRLLSGWLLTLIPRHPPNSCRAPVGRLAFDLYVSKLHRPATRPGTIRRSLLTKQLADGDDCPIVSVVAPPGYGKTTLLSQWVEASGQAFAWVSVDQGDNDPKVLLTYVAAALDAVEPIDAGVFEALASPLSSVPGSVVPRLGSALWSMSTPVVLVLDDVHLLDNRECQSWPQPAAQPSPRFRPR